MSSTKLGFFLWPTTAWLWGQRLTPGLHAGALTPLASGHHMGQTAHHRHPVCHWPAESPLSHQLCGQAWESQDSQGCSGLFLSWENIRWLWTQSRSPGEEESRGVKSLGMSIRAVDACSEHPSSPQRHGLPEFSPACQTQWPAVMGGTRNGGGCQTLTPRSHRDRLNWPEVPRSQPPIFATRLK